MKSKIATGLQVGGTAVILVGVLALLLKKFVDWPLVTWLAEEQTLSYSLGLLAWAAGYLMAQNLGSSDAKKGPPDAA